MATGMSKNELYEKYYKVEGARDSFFTRDSGFVDDALRVPMEHLFAIFSSGAVRGDTLIQYGGSIYTSLLLPVYRHFENIFIIEFLDSTVEYVNKCLDKDAKADDWNLFTKDLCNVAGDSDKLYETEDILRRKNKQVIKAELSGDGPCAPKLSTQADCLITGLCLEYLCRDHDKYRAGLKNMSSLIKIGGCLVLYTVIGCTFYMIGTCKFPVICMDEDFVKQAVSDVGFCIKEFKAINRVNQSRFSSTDFSKVVLLIACKEKDV